MNKRNIILENKGFKLYGLIYMPKNPKCIIQIIHGAKEHKERYDDFCRYLYEHDIASIIFDLRGHGMSLSKEYFLGHMGKLDLMLEDQYIIYQYIQNQFSNLDYFLFGHSLGSVFARCLIIKHPVYAKGLILSGMANYIDSVKVGLKLAKGINIISNRIGHNPLLMRLGDNGNDDWVCQNEKSMTIY